MSSPVSGDDVCVIGHPYAPIGMGEHARCAFRAFRSVGLVPGLLDIYGMYAPEPDAQQEFVPYTVQKTRRLNIHFINGDEVEDVLAALAYRSGISASYNVVYPLWELARYPSAWAKQLERFNEIWAPSKFVRDAIHPTVSRPVIHMPLATEVMISSFLGRRAFGISESAFVFMFFFDVRSFPARKNPDAVLAAFRLLLSRRPFADCVLVLKINGAELAADSVAALRESIADLKDRVVVIDRVLTENEVKNLLRCVDSFVSLHRSEGFGFGLAEAMFLGKPVICTAYSGNMDFTTSEHALLVDYRLVPVLEGQYPHWENQVWADPDVEQAAHHMATVLDDPETARRIGERASLHIRTEFSYRAAGVRYMSRLDMIATADVS